MSVKVSITVSGGSFGGVAAALKLLSKSSFARTRMMMESENLTRQHIMDNGTNKQGWPSTGFWKAVAAGGIVSGQTPDGFEITIDHPKNPGAVNQRYYGGTITAKDKLLTIPARQEFYGHSAREFSNLRFGMFKGGTKFLYVGQGGTEQDQNWGTNKQVKWQRKRGLGARAAMMIAYWLKDSVTQKPNFDIIPAEEDYIAVCHTALGLAAEEVRRKLKAA